jgi:hypothetical protein
MAYPNDLPTEFFGKRALVGAVIASVVCFALVVVTYQFSVWAHRHNNDLAGKSWRYIAIPTVIRLWVVWLFSLTNGVYCYCPNLGVDLESEKKLKYVEIKPRSKAQLLKELASDDENIVCDALYGAAQHEPDWRWSQAQCLAMLKHPSLMIRSCALIAIGEIATFRGELDVDVVEPELKRLLNDSALRPFAEDALDDIARMTQRRMDSWRYIAIPPVIDLRVGWAVLNSKPCAKMFNAWTSNESHMITGT